jgi:hypothetical protein
MTRLDSKFTQGTSVETYELGCNTGRDCCSIFKDVRDPKRICCGNLCNKLSDYDKMPSFESFDNKCTMITIISWTIGGVVTFLIVGGFCFVLIFRICRDQIDSLANRISNCFRCKKKEEERPEISYSKAETDPIS